MAAIEAIQTPAKRLLSVREFGATYSLSHATIYNLMKAGKLRTVKVLGKRLVPVDEGERLLKGQDA